MTRILRVPAAAIMAAACALASAQSPWKPAVDDTAGSLLKQRGDGIELIDTSGEMYEKQSDPRAIFIREPQHKPPYMVETTISNLDAEDPHAQAGIVAWKDPDNYLRLTAGFNPDALECLAEFGGRPRSRGTFPLYPAKFDRPITLRLEVLEHCIRGYASFDGKRWLMLGGFTTPDLKPVESFFSGIGILGIGGKMRSNPVFSKWKETPLPKVQCGELLKKELPWITAQGNSGWGTDSVRYNWIDNGLTITSFSGSDIFFGIEPYPFAGLSAPAGESYRLETKIRGFDPKMVGAFNKAGIVIWSADGRMLNIGVVADKQFNQMYLELLIDGERTTSRQFAYHDMSVSDIYLRVDRNGDNYTVSGSYDGTNWMSVEPLSVSLPEPQLRLMVSGDVFLQYPEAPPSATFEYLRCEEPK